MIQLKMNPYNDKEKKALADLFKILEVEFSTRYCGIDSCAECDYRHLCYDLDKARAHARRKAQEVSKK